jgi:ketosteroid isomerase-like protein
MKVDYFFSELTRRNVYKVALTYAVVAWLLIEAASLLLPTFDAPTWVIKAFVVFLAFGFILAVIISWAFEMTPEGLKRTADISPGEVLPYWSRRKFATFIIGVAVIAFALFVYQLLRSKPLATPAQSETASIPQKPIAVSPFESLSGSQPVEQTLRDLDVRWSKAAAAKDLEETIAYYSDDAIVLPPNSASAATKQAIRNVWKDLLASPGLVITWKATKVELGKSGDMAWVSGTYELTMKDASGRPINDRGKYLEVWEKQADGKWKCGADMWNSDLSASAPGPAEKR